MSMIYTTSFKEFYQQGCDPNRPVTKTELDKLEKYLDSVWKNLGIDVSFTRHFIDRVNDTRNGQQITVCELQKTFLATFKKYGKEFTKVQKEVEAVLTDINSNINIPFVLKVNRRTRDIELVSKTVMRKKNFRPNRDGEVHIKV